MKSVFELAKHEMQELKTRWYMENFNEALSLDEVARINEIVDDETMYDEYSDTQFVDDDFFSNQE